MADKIELRLGPSGSNPSTECSRLGKPVASTWPLSTRTRKITTPTTSAVCSSCAPGGLILIDNVLWGGRPADANEQTESTVAIRALNAKIHADERVTASLLSIGDGLTLARKAVICATTTK